MSSRNNIDLSPPVEIGGTVKVKESFTLPSLRTLTHPSMFSAATAKYLIKKRFITSTRILEKILNSNNPQ